MKSRIVIAAVLAAAAVGVAAPAVARAVTRDADEKVSQTVYADGQGYVLKLNSGCIAVYGSGADMPLFETDIRADSLRERDRDQLESGIEVESYEEIVRLLEDYNS